ncbi:hypothetical protein [Methylobacterium isbiliense]|uniref:Transcriptional regulator n=1 Tax=Methylobacterium isbiliense TaxID=315478 RepID=A0ABQ4SN15_9HYPH|nr:hypothetical protein [Methylobacterium isbiliense]MDN3627814.1 hypothetical protein [Methylobacterium isbiliense]GJE03691.1 hypothetical protein GMJLKIPL_5648 [Methylobacterium isbiliense]
MLMLSRTDDDFTGISPPEQKDRIQVHIASVLKKLLTLQSDPKR